MEDAKEVVKLMKEGYNMVVARNIHRSNKEIKQIYEQQAELEKAKEAAEAKKHRIYRMFFGTPVKSRVTERDQSGNDHEDRLM